MKRQIQLTSYQRNKIKTTLRFLPYPNQVAVKKIEHSRLRNHQEEGKREERV